MTPPIRAVLWDFGGVILDSPFDAFARYERAQGLPDGLIRRLNATNPDTNAWARLERNEVSTEEFCGLFEAEAAQAGHTLEGSAVLRLLNGDIRPSMVTAVRRCSQHVKTALLTNNFTPVGEPGQDRMAAAIAEVVALFDVVIESRSVGVRKPDRRFYELACDALSIDPVEAVFLDDLGINLKPARAMGMTTIKVTDPAKALAELESLLGFPITGEE